MSQFAYCHSRTLPLLNGWVGGRREAYELSLVKPTH